MTALLTPDSLLLPHGLAGRMDDLLASGRTDGGWLISGPKQVGKGTFALSLAGAILSGASSLAGTDEKTRALTAHEGHPDLFILRRRPDEKTGRLPANIRVDDVRDVISRFHQTASSGHRVVIVDTADEMNTAAANALLKTLEEPPRGATLLLLSAAPGRLLPTIRSRCRRLDLPPRPIDEIRDWLVAQHDIPADEAAAAADAARGRPGRALNMATGEGRLARDLADRLIAAATGRGDLVAAARGFGEKDAESARTDAQELILARLADAARFGARGEEGPQPALQRIPPHRLIDAHDEMAKLVSRSERVNGDRVQTALAMAMILKDALEGPHARR